MEIIVKITQNYGTEAIYPVCEAAQKLAQLAGTKTLTRRTIRIAKDLGINFFVIQETL